MIKLTTKQLKQIIKEELRLLTESTGIPELDRLLAEDDVESIIQGLELAESFGAPIDYQSLLMSKSEKILKDLAKSSGGSEMPELLHNIAKVTTLFSTLVSIARNPVVLPKTLEMLGSLEGVNYSNIVVHVAGNPSTPIEMLLKLSKHKTAYVRRAVARRDDTPDDILRELTIDSSENVRRAAQETLNKRMSGPSIA